MQSFLNLFETTIEITKPNSSIREFKCLNEDHQAYLCRFFNINEMEKASAEYELLRQFQGLPNFQQVLYILKCNDKQHGVLVFDWVDGQPLSDNHQTYELGKQAGKILNHLYQVEVPYNKPKRGKTRFELVDDQFNEYIESGGEIDSLDTLIELFNKNKDYFKIERLVALHGDLRAENFILTNDNELVLTNFSNHEIGDISYDLESLIFWSNETFINGALDEVELNNQIIMNTKILLYGSPRRIYQAALDQNISSIDKIVDKNRNIIQKLKGIQKISKL